MFFKDRMQKIRENSQLALPEGYYDLNSARVRTEILDQPEPGKYKKVVQISKPMFAMFKVEMSKLIDQYLDTNNMQSLFKFEEKIKELGLDYGITPKVTFVKCINGEVDVILDTVEQIEEIPGGIEEYQAIAKHIWNGVPIIDDQELLLKKGDLTPQEQRLIEGQ